MKAEIVLDYPVMSSLSAFSYIKTSYVKDNSIKKQSDTYCLTVAPSYACNLRCNKSYIPNQNPMGLEQSDLMRLVNQWSEIVVAERGAMNGTFHLKGGEPLMLPYLNDILAQLAEMKTLQFMLTTNGINATHGCIKHLKDLNRDLEGKVKVVVSIAGSNDTVNSFFHENGSLRKAVKFIRELHHADIEVHLNHVVCQENIEYIEDLVNLAAHLNVKHINFIPFKPNGYLKKMIYNNNSSIALFNRIESIWSSGDKRIQAILSNSLKNILHKDGFDISSKQKCAESSHGLLYVEPDGSVYSCPDLDHTGVKKGNIKSDSLAHIYKSQHIVYFTRSPVTTLDICDY